MWVELPPPCCGFAFPGLCPWSRLTSSSLPLKAPRMARLSGRWSRQKEGEGAGPSEASSIEAKAWTEQLQDQLGANRIYNFPTLRNLSFLSLSHSLNCSSSGVPVSAKDTTLHLSLGVTSSRKLPYFTLPSSGHVRLIWPGTSVRP